MAIRGKSSAMRATDVAAAPKIVSGRLQWLAATVDQVIDETPRTRSLVLDVPGWPGHRAGQHVDVRLTGEDGYQAQRSYSIASAPEDARVTITVERIESAALGGPLFLVAGGSGVVPLMAMLRHRANANSDVPGVLLYSSRVHADIIYRAELDALAAKDGGLKVIHTLTREKPADWRGGTRRIDREMLADIGFAPAMRPRIFICGPTPLVESAARSLRDLGHEPALIKTERFGPTGG
jgi:ferredoxin-NADP reductase